MHCIKILTLSKGILYDLATTQAMKLRPDFCRILTLIPYPFTATSSAAISANSTSLYAPTSFSARLHRPCKGM
jgi:hypothetical protein